MKPKNIALVSDAILPFNKGGKETRIYHLSRELSRLGFTIHVYTMQWWLGGKTYEAEGITYHALTKFYPLYAGNRRSIKQGILFGIGCLKLLHYDFDILEVDHIPFFPLYAAKVVSLLKHKPLYATWHEVWGKHYWRQYLGSVKGSIAYLVERLSVMLPDVIVAVSPQTLSRLETVLHYHRPLFLIPNGIDYSSIDHVVHSAELSDIIFTGRLMPHKHVDQLIEAVSRLKALRPGVRCLIIGDGPERKRLEALVTSLNLADNVQLLGFVQSPLEVFGHMKASKVFALPSTREGFGITVLEAFACGLRVVTFDHPENAARDLVSSSDGIVCEPNVASLTAALEAQLDQPANSTLPAVVADFSWDKNAAKLAEVYSQ